MPMRSTVILRYTGVGWTLAEAELSFCTKVADPGPGVATGSKF